MPLGLPFRPRTLAELRCVIFRAVQFDTHSLSQIQHGKFAAARQNKTKSLLKERVASLTPFTKPPTISFSEALS
jgi:hypothetical protein